MFMPYIIIYTMLRKSYKIKSKNKWGTLSFINRGIEYYNRISSAMKKVEKINTFKQNIKKMLLDEQTNELISKVEKKKW